MKVYLVTNKFGDDYESDNAIILGIYSSKFSAIKAIKDACDKEGFILDEELNRTELTKIIHHYESIYDYSYFDVKEFEVDEDDELEL